jgi:hypothetical protein
MRQDDSDLMINLDRQRKIYYGPEEIKTMETLTGKAIGDINLDDDFDLEVIEKIMYCGLLADAKEHNETLELEDLENLLDEAQFNEILDVMKQAFKGLGYELKIKQISFKI